MKAVARFPQVQSDAADNGIAAQFYTARKLDQASKIRLSRWMQAMGIPNAVAPGALHASVIRALNTSPGYRPDRSRIRLAPDTYRISVLGPALVLCFGCDQMQRQWLKARQAGAVMEFCDFIPHISLTYRIDNGYDWSVLSTPKLPLTLKAEEIATFHAEFAVAA